MRDVDRRAPEGVDIQRTQTFPELYAEFDASRSKLHYPKVRYDHGDFVVQVTGGGLPTDQAIDGGLAGSLTPDLYQLRPRNLEDSGVILGIPLSYSPEVARGERPARA